MTVIENEQVILFDVDQTLVIHGPIKKHHKTTFIFNPYTNVKVKMRIHEPHLRLLKERLARGASVICWSAGGYRWAKAVLKSLNIDSPNLYVLSKSIAYVDDKPANVWIGEHIYIDPDDNYK